MAHLIDSETLQTGLGLADKVSPSMQHRLDAALATATLVLQSKLRTRFEYREYTELFYVDHCVQPPLHGIDYLRLSGAPVDAQMPITVNQWAGIDLPDTGYPRDPNSYRVNTEKGLISLLTGVTPYLPGYRHRPSNDLYTNQYTVQVTYHAGYPADRNSFDDLPSWLEQAAVRVAADTYMKAAACADKEAKYSPGQQSDAERQIAMLTEQHVRWFPWAIMPEVTT